jgi:hypothetical protein
MSDADSEALKSYRIPRDRQGRGVPAFSFFPAPQCDLGDRVPVALDGGEMVGQGAAFDAAQMPTT